MKLLRKYILDKYLHTTDKALKEIRQSTAETLAVIMFKKDEVVAFQNLYGNLF
jgi:hypothetical protein